jgi:hypothetical protein
MDFKLPSMTGEAAFWEAHEEFLLASFDREVFVKMVVSPEVLEKDFERGVEIIERARPHTPLILQPLSTSQDPLGEKGWLYLEILEARALQKIPNVRIIPRLHPLLRIK